MNQRLQPAWVKYPVLLGALLFAQPAWAQSTSSVNDLLDQVNTYNRQSRTVQRQSVGASQFSDVNPSDWAYQALDDLARRYDCLKGYPNGTFRGNRPLTRYEFAAGLNACFSQIERLIAAIDPNAVLPDDLSTLERLSEDFEGELSVLSSRVDGLESRVTFLEDNQFSTTTKLVGEVTATLADSFGDSNVNGANTDETELVFHNRVRLQLVSTFSGKDRLYTRLTSGNIENSFADEIGTFEGRFAFDGRSGNNVGIDRLHYYFPVNDKTRGYVMANLGGHHFYADTFNQGLEAGGGANGALSRFAERNPIYRQGLASQGFAVRTQLTDTIELSTGYLARSGNDPTSGLFAGNYSGMVQLAIAPSSKFKFGLAYIHSYDRSGNGLFLGGTGSDLGRLNGTALSAIGVSNDFGVSSNSYGLQAKFDLSDAVSIRAWGGYTAARLIGTGDAQVWNYALGLVFPDLGSDGSMGYVLAGVEPYLGGIEATGLNANIDNDLPWHIEAAYKYKLSKNISITPGLIWLLNPDQSNSNSDILIGALRTTFSF
ncbi:MAG: iron uptake porin [Cyanobacteria bacterium P01_G01_bin.54]